MASQFVRVKNKQTGHHYTVAAEVAAAKKDLEVLKDHEATDRGGKPLGPKYKKDLVQKTSSSTTDKKENA